MDVDTITALKATEVGVVGVDEEAVGAVEEDGVMVDEAEAGDHQERTEDAMEDDSAVLPSTHN